MTDSHNAKMAKGAGWLLGAAFATRLLGAGAMLVLTRVLVPDDFGLVALATTMLAIVSVITEMQLTNALIQMPHIRPRHFNTAFTLAVLRSAIVVVALLIGGVVLSIIYREPRLVPLTAVLCLDPIANGLRSPKFAVFDKELRFAYSATLETASRLFAFFASVGLALATHSYWSIVAGQVAGTMIICIGSHIGAPYRPRLSLAAWRPILGFSLWLNFIGIVSTLSNRLDNFFVAGFLSRAVLGQYVVGNSLATLGSEAVLQPLQRALFPGFAKISGDRDALRAMFVRSQAALVSIGVPVGIIISLVAKPGVQLVIGPKWPITAQVIEFVAPILGVQLVFGPVTAIALALGETRVLFFRSLWILIVRLPTVLLGLYWGGLLGLLIARGLSGGLFLWIADATLIARLLDLPLKKQIATASRSLWSGLVLALVGVAFRVVVPVPGTWPWLVAYIIVVAGVGLVTYVAAHYALWRWAGRPPGVERDVASAVAALMKHRARPVGQANLTAAVVSPDETPLD